MSAVSLDTRLPASRADPAAVGRWLLFCCAVLLALVMLGGATRLTESGLSIVEWKPVTGVLPPIGEQAWSAEFDRYRESPQYAKVNRGMSLSEFKLIFWFEYAHRLLARSLGLVFGLPLLWFWLRGRLPQGTGWPLLGILALGAAQGYMGWYMVKSGLVDIPRVSHYRLAAHLSLALLIYACMFALALRLCWPRLGSTAVYSGHRRLYRILLGVLVVTIVFGAFVAGLRAGLIYNTFPLMAGELIPAQLLALSPGWLNWLENPVTIQFTHRWLALSVLALVLWLGWSLRRAELGAAQRGALRALLAMTLIQLSLGISTLLLKVPVWLGTLHQGGAVLLLSAVLLLGHCLRPQSPWVR
ncbi:MAG: COX15/CtaA family protein [Xanthomonadales bacterium]|nr:COX15/CtaA family protein [Xanthomonadales bacterium]